MAVGFFVDDGDEHLNSSYHTTVAHSATQTPLQSPVSHEYLVQAFCEALHRSGIAGSPGILTSPPPSPSCSHPNGNGDVFFPRGSSSSSGSGSSSSSVQPSTPSSIRMHDDYRSAQWSPRSVSVPRRRYRLTSASDEDDYDDEQPSYDDYEERYIAPREHLPEFSGRIPPRKKRDTINAQQPRKARDPKMWPAVAVTAVVLAVGCGFLVSR
ncbi:cell death protein hid [Sitodiplosis mosellana]|uniref:cell death protein hid n=1 Tax=Sitodiplosis mosellana TaxID=263140 RepID=UPI0024442D58|nr:cell death protein hid [Sitodiplosis mosellana]